MSLVLDLNTGTAGAWTLACRPGGCTGACREPLGVPDQHPGRLAGRAGFGCYGELGPASPAVAAQTRWHKEAFRAYLRELAAAAALPEPVADSLYLLAEGAMVTAAIFATAEPASRARSAAEQLLATARVTSCRNAGTT